MTHDQAPTRHAVRSVARGDVYGWELIHCRVSTRPSTYSLDKALFVSLGLVWTETQSTRIRTATNEKTLANNYRSVKLGLE